jgi:Tol biopolymer transport system component
VIDLTSGSVVRGEPRKVVDVDGDMFGLTWTADSRQLVFASGPLSGTSGNSKTLTRVDAREGASPEHLPLGSDLTLPAISRSGARLAFVKTSYQADIYRLTLVPPGAMAPAPERFVSSTRSDWNPQYSPDGLRLAFESTRPVESAVWMSDEDGSNLVEVFSKAGKHSGTPRWSPDSQRLAFDSSADGNFDVYVIRPGSREPQRLTSDAADDAIPSWSPDGRWIYFASSRTGRYEIWKVPSGGGTAVQVTQHGGLCAFPSKDGTNIYYTKHDGDSPLWVMPVTGGPEREVLPSVVERTFDVVADGVFFVPRANPGSGYAVHYLELATSTVRPVFPVAGAPAIGLSLSPDRRHALYAQKDAADRDLMLVEGFR